MKIEYLFVNFSGLKKIKYDDNNKQYYTEKIFSKSKDKLEDIPKEYRKMILVLSEPITDTSESEECITRAPFKISNYTKKNKDKDQMIGLYQEQNIIFSTDKDFKDQEAISEFYTSLEEKGLYGKYVDILTKILTPNERKKTHSRK